jgi:hypothetical protein
MVFPEQHPVNDDEDANQKHEDRDPIYPVHIFDPGIGRFIWISLYDVKVFADFS